MAGRDDTSRSASADTAVQLPLALPRTEEEEVLFREKRLAEIKARRWNRARSIVRQLVEEGAVERPLFIEPATRDLLELGEDVWKQVAGLDGHRRAVLRKAARLGPLDLDEIILLIPGFDPRTQAGDCYFDAEEAQDAIDFFHELVHHVEGEWAGRPFELELWQQAVIGNLFGWKRPDGFRRFKNLFLFIPRKNGKSPLAAGIILKLLTADGEPGAQVYGAAGSAEQAGILHYHAGQMVELEPYLDARCRVYKVPKSIVFEENGSVFKVLSKKAKTKHGLNVHGAVIDELHVIEDRESIKVLTSATGTRRQPVIAQLTTADFDRPSLCNERQRYAEKVRDGVIDDAQTLPVLYQAKPQRTMALDPDDKDSPRITLHAWDSLRTFRSCNPNLGVSIKPFEVLSEIAEARHSALDRADYERLRLNRNTATAVAAISMEHWAECAKPRRAPHDLDAWIDEMGLEGADCWGGLDLSSSKDLTAFVLLFPDNDWAVLPFFWAPRYMADLRDQGEGVSYTAWQQEGWINLHPGPTVDYERVRLDIGELGDRFRIQEINFDRFEATKMSLELADDGFDMVKFGQGTASMSEPSKMLERHVLNGELAHGGHPVLTWNASNLQWVTNAARSIKPDKGSETERIDGMVALIMAFGGVLIRDEDGQGYGDEGIRTV